jgi:hypothetical protein
VHYVRNSKRTGRNFAPVSLSVPIELAAKLRDKKTRQKATAKFPDILRGL